MNYQSPRELLLRPTFRSLMENACLWSYLDEKKKLHLLKGSSDKKIMGYNLRRAFSPLRNTYIQQIHTLTHIHIHTGAYIMCNGFVYLFSCHLSSSFFVVCLFFFFLSFAHNPFPDAFIADPLKLENAN